MKKILLTAVILSGILAFASCGRNNPAAPAATPTVPTPLQSITNTPNNTATQINTPSETPTITMTITSYLSSTPSETPTRTITLTSTLTFTRTNTGTRTFTPSITVTRTGTLTATVSPTVTVSPTASISATITETGTETQVCSPTTTPTALNCTFTGNEVVISQIYGGASSSVMGASYNYDFVVLHNRSNCPFTMTNWSIQYATANGTSITNNTALNATIQAGGYYLIRLYGPGLDGSALPPHDASGSMNIAHSAGKLYLCNQAANVSLAAYGCPAGNVKDFVGYGGSGGVSCWDGASPVSAPLVNQGCLRKNSGCQDTNSNLADFTVSVPSPENSASGAVVCP